MVVVALAVGDVDAVVDMVVDVVVDMVVDMVVDVVVEMDVDMDVDVVGLRNMGVIAVVAHPKGHLGPHRMREAAAERACFQARGRGAKAEAEIEIAGGMRAPLPWRRRRCSARAGGRRWP